MTHQLFLRGLDAKTISLRISEDAKIAKIRQILCDKALLKADDIRMFSCDKELKDSNENCESYLSDYQIRKGGIIFLVVRLTEASNIKVFNFTDTMETERMDLIDTEYRILDSDVDDLSFKLFREIITEPPLKIFGPDVELTSEPDMITFDDRADSPRGKMPCGHAIGTESLTTYCRTLITNGEYKFKCPHVNPPCNHIWEFETIKRFAGLTDEEVKEFEIKIAMNYLNNAIGIHECPQCKSFCERQTTKAVRVVCPICTRKRSRLYEFCWYCRKVWLSSSDNDCGNANCSSEDPRKKILREAPLKVVIGLNCPSMRACPKCGWIIEHVDGCKHMVCRCTQKFCFICLKLADSFGNYQCGASSFQCPLATCQTELP